MEGDKANEPGVRKDSVELKFPVGLYLEKALSLN